MAMADGFAQPTGEPALVDVAPPPAPATRWAT